MPDYKIVNGVCRPQTFEVLKLYKGIQRETNRLLDILNKKLLYVDGRIGDSTRKGVNLALDGAYGTCAEIASKAQSIFNVLRQQANARNAPVVADPDRLIASIISPPSKFDPDTNTVINPNWKTAGVGGIPFWAMLLLGGGSYYYLYGGGKKKTRKSLTR